VDLFDLISFVKSSVVMGGRHAKQALLLIRLNKDQHHCRRPIREQIATSGQEMTSKIAA
jgi:hypothetical protein